MKVKIFISIVALVSTIGCTKKFDEINSNPNKSNVSRADWLATSMISSISSDVISSQKSFMQPYLLGKYILWSEDQEGYQYNSLGSGSFGSLVVLRNVDPMLSYASTDSKTFPSYYGLSKFIRAWQFFQTTISMGDIPYSEAVNGETDGIVKPSYDTQKEVFLGILNELDQADSAFALGSTFTGDFIYNGDVNKWRKLTNSFELHVLINLYKKTDDADLDIINRFKKVAARTLMESYSDNFSVTYQNTAGFAYPWSNTDLQKNQFTIYPMISSTIIDSLKAHNDRRLFYYAEPAASATNNGLLESDFNAYIGVEPSDAYSSTTTLHSAGKFSDLNKRYAALYNAEPVSLFSYWEQEFVLAEAAIRGWISDDAETHYENGIKGSMAFLANYAGSLSTSTYIHGMPLTSDYINSYLQTVQLTGSTDNKIMQIITQKYFAGFLQGTNNNAWFENRRTGYPVFKLNTSTNLNTPSSEFPVRWKYPSSEQTQNADNYKAAIQSQYAGVDDANQIMWLLK